MIDLLVYKVAPFTFLLFDLGKYAFVQIDK
jgi:hypothetical protein